MRFNLGSCAASAAVFALAARAATLTMNTPTTTLYECRNLLLSWTGGTAPYYLYVYNSSGTALESLTYDDTDATEGTWTINQPEGTVLYFAITDDTGATAESATVTVEAGTTDCTSTTVFSVSGNANAAVATDAAAATTAADAGTTTSSSAAAASTSAGSSSSSAVATATGTASSASSTSSSTSGAGAVKASLAGLVGAGLLALMA